jgi:hypothetical protein
MKTTKYATHERAIQCSDKAQKVSAERNYIENDDARAYVLTHSDLLDKIANACTWMYKARYSWYLSNALGENGRDVLKRSSDECTKAERHRDEAMAMLDCAEDIDCATYKYLIEYLHDLTTI